MEGLTPFGTLAAMAARTAPDRVRAAVTKRLKGKTLHDAEGWRRFVTWLLHLPISESSPAAQELCLTIATTCNSALRLMAIERLVHIWGGVDSAQDLLAQCEPAERVEVLERCWRAPSAWTLCRDSLHEQDLWENRDEVDRIAFAARGWEYVSAVRSLVSGYFLRQTLWNQTQGAETSDGEVVWWRDRARVACVLSESRADPELIGLIAGFLVRLKGAGRFRDAQGVDLLPVAFFERVGAWKFAPGAWSNLIDVYEHAPQPWNLAIVQLFANWGEDVRARRFVLRYLAADISQIDPSHRNAMLHCKLSLTGWSQHPEARTDYIRFLSEAYVVMVVPREQCNRTEFAWPSLLDLPQEQCSSILRRGYHDLLRWSPSSDTDAVLEAYVTYMTWVRRGGLLDGWLFNRHNSAQHPVALQRVLCEVLRQYRERRDKYKQLCARNSLISAERERASLAPTLDEGTSLWCVGSILDPLYGWFLVHVVHTLVDHLSIEDGAKYIRDMIVTDPPHPKIVESMRKNEVVQQILVDPNYDPTAWLVLNLKFGEETWTEETQSRVNDLLSGSDQRLSARDAKYILANHAAELSSKWLDQLADASSLGPIHEHGFVHQLSKAAKTPTVASCLLRIFTDEAWAQHFATYIHAVRDGIVRAAPPESNLFDQVWAATFTQPTNSLARAKSSPSAKDWDRYPNRPDATAFPSSLEQRLDERDGFSTSDGGRRKLK